MPKPLGSIPVWLGAGNQRDIWMREPGAVGPLVREYPLSQQPAPDGTLVPAPQCRVDCRAPTKQGLLPELVLASI